MEISSFADFATTPPNLLFSYAGVVLLVTPVKYQCTPAGHVEMMKTQLSVTRVILFIMQTSSEPFCVFQKWISFVQFGIT